MRVTTRYENVVFKCNDGRLTSKTGKGAWLGRTTHRVETRVEAGSIGGMSHSKT